MKKTNSSHAIVVADVVYGDAGKGSIVDYLSRLTGAHTVVRYNGGAQAAHNVITPDGRHHTFSQFGSGTFVPGTKTYLSQHMLVNPYFMFDEEERLQKVGVSDAFNRMFINDQALVTSPYQQGANRIKEICRGDGRHGSCGMGIGETMSDFLFDPNMAIYAGDTKNKRLIRQKLYKQRDYKWHQLQTIIANAPKSDQLTKELSVFLDICVIDDIADFYYDWANIINIVDESMLTNLLHSNGTVIFEGAQGVLLDEWYGFYPYNTWTTLTYKHADSLLNAANFDGKTTKLGLTRGYFTRHGAGPFVTEDYNLSSQIQDYHNTNNLWQREFRVGHMDLVALKYGLDVVGKVDGLVITNLDRMEEANSWKVCSSYQYQDPVNDKGMDLFLTDSTYIHGIRVPTEAQYMDLNVMQIRTNILSAVKPIYERCTYDLKSDKNTYLEHICSEVGIPLAISSAGPRATDKTNFLI